MNRAIEKLLEKCFVISRIKIIPFSANPTKWSNILKQFVGNLPTNCLSTFGRFVGLSFKGLRSYEVSVDPLRTNVPPSRAATGGVL